jgi:hypothetical protein
MFEFGTASFSISRGGGGLAGDRGLERFGALARAELCAEEGGALIVWIGAGDVDVLASGSVTARACGAGAGRAGVEAGAAAVRGRTFVVCEGEGCWTARRAGFSAECMASLAWRDAVGVSSEWRAVRGPRAYRLMASTHFRWLISLLVPGAAASDRRETSRKFRLIWLRRLFLFEHIDDFA